MEKEKARRLTDIARLYYDQDKTQHEIAAIYGISRPLVSRLLKEARAVGIVRIEVRGPLQENDLLWARARQLYGLVGGATELSVGDDNSVNDKLAHIAVDYLRNLKGDSFGIGWGTIIGVMVSALEGQPARADSFRSICPLVGNSSVSTRSYHSNENVRIVARHFEAEPHYLYTPAFVETQQERALICQTEHYRSVYHQWERLDVALVNIGNYPSVPDFASASRFGDLLVKGRAAGRLLAYYYDINGGIFHCDTDYSIEIPIELLRRCRNVVGICSANVRPRALAGALRSGLISHIVCTEELLQSALEYDGQ